MKHVNCFCILLRNLCKRGSRTGILKPFFCQKLQCIKLKALVRYGQPHKTQCCSGHDNGMKELHLLHCFHGHSQCTLITYKTERVLAVPRNSAKCQTFFFTSELCNLSFSLRKPNGLIQNFKKHKIEQHIHYTEIYLKLGNGHIIKICNWGKKCNVILWRKLPAQEKQSGQVPRLS